MKRSSVLDILKGVCICTVIFTHFGWSDPTRLKFFFPIWVDMAIPLCMIISGYVYTKSFRNREIKTAEQAYSYENGQLYRWIVRYTVPFIFSWILELIILESLQIRDWPSCKNLVSEFLTGGYGPGSYYYPVLVQLIFIFPIVYLCILRKKHKGLFLCCLFNIIYELLQWAYGLNSSTYRLLVFRYLFLFSFGCYFAIDGKLNKYVGFAMFILGLLFSYVNSYKGITLFFITNWQTTSFLTTLHTVPLFYLLKDINIKCKPLELVGKASYHIFLTQMIYYVSIAGLAYQKMSFIGTKLCFSFLFCIGCGIIFYLIEAPISKYCISRIEYMHNAHINRC